MGRHQRRGRHAADCQRVHVRPLENGKIDEQLKSLRNRLSVLESQALEITKDDVVGFAMHGFDRTDEDMIFGAVVRQAYLFTDCVLLVFNFRDEVGDLAEIRFALQAQDDMSRT